jgi:hypothetical protein
LYLIAGISRLANADWWYWLTFIAVLLSTILIITVWKDAKFGTIANSIILAGAIIGYGSATFYGWYQKEVSPGMNQKSVFQSNILTEADLQNLPKPTRKQAGWFTNYTG